MPKHKKTLEQKRKADERKISSFQQQTTQPSSIPSYSFSSISSIEKNPSKNVEHPHTHIVRGDLTKTFYVSLFILALQIIFYILLRNHMLAISFVRY